MKDPQVPTLIVGDEAHPRAAVWLGATPNALVEDPGNTLANTYDPFEDDQPIPACDVPRGGTLRELRMTPVGNSSTPPSRAYARSSRRGEPYISETTGAGAVRRAARISLGSRGYPRRSGRGDCRPAVVRGSARPPVYARRVDAAGLVPSL